MAFVAILSPSRRILARYSVLDILPSPELQFHDHIRIVWLGKTDPTVHDLKPFVEVRKDKVLRALLWLCANNPLYKSVTINHDLINQWDCSFIPPVLQEILSVDQKRRILVSAACMPGYGRIFRE